MKTRPASHVDDRLASWVEGCLPVPERTEVAAHLEECAGCRAAEAQARTGLEWTRALRPAVLPDEAAERVRRALARSRPAPGAGGFGVTAAAAAAVLLAALAAVGPTPREARPGRTLPPASPAGLVLYADPGPPTPFEKVALDRHSEHAVGGLRLDLHTASVPGVREWAERTTGLGVSLSEERPAEDGGAYVLEGAGAVPFGAAKALLVAYRVDGRPVTLLTTRAEDAPGQTPEWNAGGKHVRFRRVGGRKLLAWTNAGQTYVLVSDFAGYGQRACLLCHTSAARREEIRALGASP